MTLLFFFFFNDTATTEIYTLSLHDALPIYHGLLLLRRRAARLPHDRPCDRGPSRRRRPAALLRLGARPLRDGGRRLRRPGALGQGRAGAPPHRRGALWGDVRAPGLGGDSRHAARRGGAARR